MRAQIPVGGLTRNGLVIQESPVLCCHYEYGKHDIVHISRPRLAAT